MLVIGFHTCQAENSLHTTGKTKCQCIGRALAHHQVASPVVLPAFFVMLLAKGPFFTIADRIDAARADTLADEEFLDGIGSPGAG
jgi:hypothetical protein